ncbi:MAG: BspA family leucine-rich repeat surface protein, partial [Muribaculaceae bacterium]|nr:BspA family leucine-rich repeat surface protein [Muribaculaceae bacterium]
MKNHSLLIRLVALVAAMMCALGASAAEAYANYTPSNTTLTFYYDNLRSSRTGTTYDLNTGSQYTDWDNDGTKDYVTKVVFHSSFANYRPTTTFDWFYGMGNLQSFTGMSYLNTSEVTNMSLMFQSCTQLTSLDLSHFNTSKVTDMGGMFSNSTSLRSLDLSSFNTSKVTNMGWMFNKCSNLRTIYVGNGWTTAAVTSSTNMFSDCISLMGGEGTTYNASNPKDKTYAHIDGGTSNPGYFTEKGPEAYACYTPSNTTLTFYYDNQRSSRTGTTYDLNLGINYTDWETDGTNANVTKVVFDPSFAGARPTTTSRWFYSMANLQSITGMSYLNTSEVTIMAYMFTGCNHLPSLDLSHFNTSKVTGMYGMFEGCSGLTSLDLSSFNTSQVTNLRSLFSGCSSLTSLDLSSFNTSKVTNMRYVFANNSNLRTIYVGSGWSTAAMIYSDDMFDGCTSLVGGQGTTYDADHVDGSYARIDGGPNNPGYFSEKGPEAYACYTPSNTTLTFYYDTQRNSRPGTTYDLNTGNNHPGWETDGTNANVTKVVFDPSFANARPTTTYSWFCDMGNLQS